MVLSRTSISKNGISNDDLTKTDSPPVDPLKKFGGQLVQPDSRLMDSSTNNYAVNNGTFRGTQDEYNQYLASHPQTTDLNKPIDASTLGSSNGYQVAPPAPTIDPSGFVFSNAQLLQDYKDAQTKATELENNNSTLQKRITDTLNSQKTSAQLYQEQTDKLGLDAKRKQIEEGNLQIAQKTGEFDKSVQAIGDQAIPMGFITGQQQSVRLRQAAEIGALASVQQALQGNYALAQQTADKAVELQFNDQQTQIKNLQMNLEMNYQNMTAAEKKRADALKLTLDQQQQELEKAKADRTQVLNLAAEAAKNGADNSVLTQMSKAKNAEEALQIGGSFLGANERNKMALETAQFSLDAKYKQAQIANIQSEIANRSSSGNLANVDPSQVLAYAQQYASDGKIPTNIPKGSFGLISQVAKELPKPDGTLVDINTGIKPSKLSAAQADGVVALKDLIQKIDSIKETYSQSWHGLVGGIKNWAFPSQANQQYNDMRLEISDLLARARTGAAINTSEERIYNGKLPGNFNETFFLGADGKTKIDDLKKSLEGKLQTNLKTNGLAIYGYSKVKIGDQEYTVGDVVSNGKEQGRINPDGSITKISQ